MLKRHQNQSSWRVQYLFAMIPMWFLCSSLTMACEQGANLSDAKHLKESDIEALIAPIRFDTLERDFGCYLEADRYAIGWPKSLHSDMSDTQKWKRAYWFFYLRDDKGKPTKPVTLEFIASLPENVKETSAPWVELLPHMTVDWPATEKGLRLSDVYFD